MARSLCLKYYFYRKYPNLKKNHTKNEKISCVHTKLQKNLFNFEFYAGPAFQ